jgi:hypothetical protein
MSPYVPIPGIRATINKLDKLRSRASIPEAMPISMLRIFLHQRGASFD